MKSIRMIQCFMLLMMVSFSVSGCIGLKPFPLAARPGDTIGIALGGPNHEVVPGDEITLNDLTITVEQDTNSDGIAEIFPVTGRYLFRLYPDNTSMTANFNMFYQTPAGEWIAFIDLADPASGSPLPLIAGPATVKVVSPKLKNNAYSTYEGSLDNIPIDILPGTGVSHTFNDNNWGKVVDLQPLPQLALSFSGATNLSVAELVIDYDETVLTNMNNIKVRQYLNKPGIVLFQNVYDDNGNKKIKMILMANKGTKAPTVMKCFIVWDPASVTGIVDTNTFNIISSKFYDDNGAAVTGISVVKNLLYQ